MEIAFIHPSSVRPSAPMINYNSGLREIMMRSRTTKTYRVSKKFILAVWETCTEYHCTPTKVFLKFSQSLRRPPTVATWLKGQSTDWLKHRAQSGVKRCTCINLLVGFSGKGLGHSLKPVRRIENLIEALGPPRSWRSFAR